MSQRSRPACPGRVSRPRHALARDGAAELSFPTSWRCSTAQRAEQVAGRIAEADIVITNKAPGARGGAGRARSGCGWWRWRRPAPTWSTSRPAMRAGHHRLEHPQLRGQHRARAHLRADPGAAPQHPAPTANRWRAAGGGRRRSSAISTTRSATSPARRWASSATARWASRWPKLGEAFGMKVLFSDYKGTTGMGPLYTPFGTCCG